MKIFFVILSGFALACLGASAGGLEGFRDCHQVNGGMFYELSVSAKLPISDATNDYAVGACLFRFFKEGTVVAADHTLLSNTLKQDSNTGLEFLFPDGAVSSNDVFRWTFQFRVPDVANELEIEVKPWSKISRADFTDIQLRMSTQPVYRLDSCNPIIRKFNTRGFCSKLQIDGVIENRAGESLPDFSFNINIKGGDPANWFSSAYAFSTNITSSVDGAFSVAVALPHNVTYGTVELHSDIDSDALIRSLRICPEFSTVVLPYRKVNEVQYRLEVLQGDKIFVDCDFIGDASISTNKKGAIVAVSFTSKDGALIRSPQLPHSAAYGDYWYVSTRPGEFHSKKTLIAPAGARGLTLGIAGFAEKGRIDLTAVRVKTDVADFRTELIKASKVKSGSGSEVEDMESVVTNWLNDITIESLLRRFANARFALNHCDSIIGKEHEIVQEPYMLGLKPFPKVALSDNFDWNMDPFGSLSWKMNFATCYWIPFQSVSLNSEERLRYCKKVWLSFQRVNLYPRYCNTMVYADHACAARIEAALLTIFGHRPDSYCSETIPALDMDLLLNDRELLIRLMYQLYVDVGMVEYYLRSKIYDVHNHNLLMARSLLSFVNTFPLPEFERYRQLAFSTISDHFVRLFEPDGYIREQSAQYHHWVLLHFVDIYLSQRRADPKSREFGKRLAELIRADVALTTPAGRSFPIGDGSIVDVISSWKHELKRLSSADPETFTMSLKPDVLHCAYPVSGLYAFRDRLNTRTFLVNLSDSIKAHGHRDLGSWHYASDGVVWITELGGPYKYGTRYARDYATSDSHTLIHPKGRRQASGVAYAISRIIEKGRFTLSAKSNVNGPNFDHDIFFSGDENLEEISARNVFHCALDCEFIGRIVLGEGVFAFCEDKGKNIWSLCTMDGKKIWIAIQGKVISSTRLVNKHAAWYGNKLTPTQTIEYSARSIDGICDTTIKVYNRPPQTKEDR